MGELQTCYTVESLQNQLSLLPPKGLLGFVPTMGALHNGHLSLVKRALEECDKVVVSIFVNPTQFNNPDDFKRYPRTLERDLELLSALPIIVFAPEYSEVYPASAEGVAVDLGRLDQVMEGEFRPGHFNGVVNVVHRLFTMVQPDLAYFGEKDFQQLAVIRHMVKSLGLPVKIVGCPILRESNGLAMSSRNELLTPEQRHNAGIIYQVLLGIKEDQKRISIPEAQNKAIKQLEAAGLTVEYVEVVDGDSLESLKEWQLNSMVCLAVQSGFVRLIDNISLS